MPTKTATAKTIVKFVVAHSVSVVVVSIIHQNTETFSTPQKVKLYVGAYTLGAMAAKQAGEWTDAKVDELVEAYHEVKEALKSM